MGEDGHTASIFADAPEWDHAITTTERFVAVHPGSAPHARVSWSMSALKEVKHLFLLIAGPRKLDVLNAAARFATKKCHLAVGKRQGSETRCLLVCKLRLFRARASTPMDRGCSPTSAAPMRASRWKTAPGEIGSVQVYPCADYPGVAEVIKKYLKDTKIGRVNHAAIAIANPVDGDQVEHDQSRLELFDRSHAPRARLRHAARRERLYRAGDGAAGPDRRAARAGGRRLAPSEQRDRLARARAPAWACPA